MAAGSTARWSWVDSVLASFMFALAAVTAVAGTLQAVWLARATGRIDATVTSVRETRSSSQPVHSCATLRWSHGGTTFEREVEPCSEDSFVVGARVPIRVDPEDPSRVYLDSFGGSEGSVVVLYAVALFGIVGLVRALRKWRAARGAAMAGPS